MRTHAKLSVFPLLCGALLLCGCFDEYHIVDGNPSIRNGHILGRRYMLAENRTIPIAVPHAWLELLSSQRPAPLIDLPAGTLLRTAHVEEESNFAFGRDVVLALLENGADAGRSVVIGTADFDRYNDPDLPASFGLIPADWQPGVSGLKGAAFPYPTGPPPPWLDLHPPDTQPSRAQPFVPPPQARPTSTAVLADALHNPDWAVRYYAVLGIGDRWLTDDIGAHAIQIALRDPDFAVRSAAAGAIRRDPAASRSLVFADAIQAALIQTLTDSKLNGSDREEAASALVAMGPRVIPAMTKIVDAHQQDTLPWAARVIGGLGPDAEQCLPALARAVPFERGLPSTVISAMGRIDPLASTDLLVPMLRDKSAVVREASASGMHALGEALAESSRPNSSAVTARAVEALIPLLNDPSENIRSEALEALGSLGSAARPALPAIEEYRKRPSAVEGQVSRVIGSIQSGG